MPRYILRENLILDADGGPPFADLSTANILDDSSLAPSFFNWPATASSPSRRIFLSGWRGETPFSLTHATWTKESWSLFDRWCDAALPHLQHNNAVACFRPHTRHILSDPQACLTFLRRREERGAVGDPRFEILLEPTAFLTPAMLPRAEDHLTRAMDALAHHAAVAAILLTNITPSPEDPSLFVPAPLNRGLLPPTLMDLIASRAPPSLKVITLD